MNWKDYEKEIFEYLSETHKDANIKFNQKLKGRYSKTDRQIDVLIETYIASKKIRFIVDCKYFNKKIDVKDVEAFISMVEDVEAKQGILVTSKGYSEASINRAYHGPTDIELDILNFEELKQLQGFEGIFYSGKYGVIVPSPFGWIIDGTKRNGLLTTFYQRGLTFEEATKNKEFIYANIFTKNAQINNIYDLTKLQESLIKDSFPKAVFEYDSTVKGYDNAKTLLRTIIIENYPTDEYTGFIEFEEYFVFFVLFTPLELKEKNLRKLQNLIERTIPVNINLQNSFQRDLDNIQLSLNQSCDIIEKAELLIEQGEILIKLKRYEDANSKYDESIAILPTSYGAIKGKIYLDLLQKRAIEVFIGNVDTFYELEPTNPLLCTDLVNLFSEFNRIDDCIYLLKYGSEKYKNNQEANGNFNYHIGLILMNLGQNNEAKQYFILSEFAFKKSLTKDHYVFSLINQNLLTIKKLLKKQK